MSDSNKQSNAVFLKQYELLTNEVLEIHSRSDRLEQFFVVAIGAIYGFALTREQELRGFVYFVPVVISFFAFIRLELLSRVRGIVRQKQIELEERLLPPGTTGAAKHFQEKFYQTDLPNTDRSVGFCTLFDGKVSDRAVFWRAGVFLSFLLALIMNIEGIRSALRSCTM